MLPIPIAYCLLPIACIINIAPKHKQDMPNMHSDLTNTVKYQPELRTPIAKASLGNIHNIFSYSHIYVCSKRRPNLIPGP